MRYELTVGENVGVGDIDAVDEVPRLERAAEKGMAAPFIAEWPEKYRTQRPGSLVHPMYEVSTNSKN